jgi:prepilin peptidase CpaA
MGLQDDMQLVYLAALAVCLGLAAGSDIRERRIPNTLPLALIALYPGAFALGFGASPWWAGIAIAFTVFAAGALVFAFGILGGGDVKLLAAVALWAGPAWIFEALLVTALAGGAAALLAMLRPLVLTPVFGPQPGAHETTLPYGVAIAGGGLWVLGRLFAL